MTSSYTVANVINMLRDRYLFLAKLVSFSSTELSIELLFADDFIKSINPSTCSIRSYSHVITPTCSTNSIACASIYKSCSLTLMVI